MKRTVTLNPDFELIEGMPAQSLRWYAHGYPCELAKWHYHPEYEIHLIEETTGKVFVGDYIGSFAPGNLILTGPNLPHNWLSDVDRKQSVRQRDMLVQFGDPFVRQCINSMPDLAELEVLLDEAKLGIEFFGGTAHQGWDYLRRIGSARGMERLILFLRLLQLLTRTTEKRTLCSSGFIPHLNSEATSIIDTVMKHMIENSARPIRLADVAALAGMSETAFSRFFRRNTGHTFVQYLNRLRISRACDLLMHSDKGITEICFDVGYNNISNFNRQFARVKSITPSAYRRQAVRNLHPPRTHTHILPHPTPMAAFSSASQ